MNRAFAAFAILVVFSGAPTAQSMSADEKAIRDLIVKGDAAGQRPAETADSVFFSGALKRPRIGRDSKPELMSGMENRIGQKIKTSVRRIGIANSGDLAYEFSDAELTTEEKGSDGKPTSNTFMTSSLRVWKKVGGQWQVAAHFAKPHEP